MRRIFLFFVFLAVSTITFSQINPPNLFSPSNGSVNNRVTIELDWAGALGNSGYIYEVDITSSFNSSLKISGGYNNNISRITINELKYGQLYYWRIATKYNSNADTTAWSSVWTFTTADQPILISPTNNRTNENPTLDLDWSAIIGSTNYLYEADTTTAFNSNELKKGTTIGVSSIVNVSDLKFGEKYYWRIAALHSSDTSNWSVIRNFTTVNSTSLVSPANNSINEPISLTLDWSFVAGNSGYIYEVDTSVAFNSPIAIKVSTTSNVSEATVSNLRFGEKYYWRVAVKTPSDTSAWSAVRSFTTSDQVNLVSPSNNSTNLPPVLRLDWTFLSGNNGYIYEVDTSLNFNSPIAIKGSFTSNTSEVNISNLRFGAMYYWRVAVKSSVDTSAWSAIYNFTVLDQVNLVSPSNNLQNTGIRVKLDWAGIIGNNGYLYEVDTVPTFNSPLLLSGSFTNNLSEVEVNNLKFGTTYFWRIAVKTTLDTSMWSTVNNFTTSDQVNLVAPANNSTAQNVAEELDWNSIIGITSYIYEIDTSSTFNSPLRVFGNSSGTNSKVTVTNLRFGTTYYWRVAAINNTDTSSYSSVFNFITKDNISLFTPVNNFVGTSILPRLDWGSISGSTNYIYEVDTSINFNSPLLVSGATPNSNSQVDVNILHYGTKYYWRVAARTINDTSNWSAIRNFTTTDNVNLQFPVNNASNLPPNVTISWNRITGSTDYIYEVDVVPTFNSPTIITGSIPNSFILNYGLTNLLTGQDYYWRVAAVSSVDTSSFSSFRKFSTSFSLTTPPTQLFPLNNDSNIQRNGLMLDWSDDPNASQYQVQLDTVNNFTATTGISTLNSSQWNLTRRENFTTYYWRVRSKNTSGNSPWSPVWSFTTDNCDNSDSITVANCGTYFYGGRVYTSSGMYTRVFRNAQNCDSTVYLDLTINRASSSTLNLVVCDSLLLNGQTYFNSGNYTQTIANSVGCDSTINLSLMVNNSFSDTAATVIVCDSFIWARNGITYYASGIYSDTLTTVNGCDSIQFLEVNITNSTTSLTTINECDSFVWRGSTLTQSGMYRDTISNGNNCDSIIVLDLTINNTTTSSQTINSCDDYTWNGTVFTSSGTYRDTILNAKGCDSLMTLNLTVRDSTTNSLVINTCDSIRINGQLITQTAIYTQRLMNSVGCDSVLTLDVTVNSSVNSTIVVSSCNSYFWSSTNRFYTTSGMYDTTFQTASGCDSLVEINLTVTTVNVGVTRSGINLSANQNNATYQWLDCNNGFSPILNQTAQTYSPTQNGSYAVEVSSNNCTDTSACQLILTIGIEELIIDSDFTIYPNPFESEFTIDFGADVSPKTVEVFNLQGNLLLTKQNVSGKKYELELLQPSGVYIVRVISGKQASTYRIVKR